MNEVIVAEPTQTAVAPRSANPMDMQPEEFRGALTRRGANRRSLIEWIRESLVEGTDYGRIHVAKNCDNKYRCTKDGHFSKPSLRKPGAEKICGMLGVTATFPTLSQYEQAALDGKDIHSIILRCHLVSADGQVVADGIGARSIQQDHGDLNKALKMASKSAHIDATLRMAGLSEIFTQDLEDMPHGIVEAEGGSHSHPTPAPVESRPPSDVVPSGKHKGKPWSEISADYLSWAVNSDRAPAPLKDGANRELIRRDALRTVNA